MVVKLYRFSYLLIFLALSCPYLVSAKTYTVDTNSELDSAIAAATGGDEIVISNGTYSNWKVHFNSTGGSGSKLITLRAEDEGKVIFTGSSAYWAIEGDYLVVSGFQFKNISRKYFMRFRDSEHSRLTNCKFYNVASHAVDIRGTSDDAGEYIGPSRYNRIDHCTFEKAAGLIIEIYFVSKSTWTDLKNTHNRIDHNYFKNTPFLGQAETIQVGRGSSLFGSAGGYPTEFGTDAHTIIEYNYFENYNGDNELISIKSSSNTIRYNVVLNCDSSIKLRGGDDNLVEGNFVFWKLGTSPPKGYAGGLFVQGTNHIIRNNYIEGTIAGIFMEGGNGSTIPDIKNVLVLNNTLVGTTIGYKVGSSNSSKHPNPPSNIKFVNNVDFSNKSGGASAGFYHNKAKSTTYQNNYAMRPSGVAVDPDISSGVKETDVKLSYDGVLMNRPDPNTSPLVDGGVQHPELYDDIDGHSRSSSTVDAGCDEINADTVWRNPISGNNSGVYWEQSGSASTSIEPPHYLRVVPN